MLLALMMVVGLLPMAALAAEGGITPAEGEQTYVAQIGENKYETLQKAINAANGNTVKLLKNVTEDITIHSNKNVTLDLNGHKLTNASGHTITVEKGGELNISDSVGTGVVDNTSHGKGAIVNSGEVTLNGGTFKRSAEKGTYSPYRDGGNSWYTIANYGTMKINTDVTVENAGGYSSMIRNGGDVTADCNLTIGGGNFVGGVNTVKNDSFGVLTINGGNFSNTAQYVIMNWNKAEITAGTFQTLDTASAVLFTSAYGGDDNTVGKLTISGGEFKHASDTQEMIVDHYNASNSGTAAVTGGKFDADISKYIPTDYVQSADGTVEKLGETNSVAKIGDTYYASLAAAVAAADNSTVTLLKDANEAIIVPAGKTVTIDLNGKEFTHSGWLSVENGSNLILANGSINADIWVSGGNTEAQTTKLTIGSDVVLSGSFPIVVEGGTNLGSGKGTYGFSKVEIAGTVKASSSGVWVMGNLGNGTESMAQMTMNSNVIDVQSTAKIIGVGNDNLGVTIMGLATVNVANRAEISGSEGIFVKRGTLNINGGTISGNRSSFTLPPNANNNGAEEVGAALVISSTYNNYGTIDVNINGGTFTSAYGNAVYVGHTVNKNSSVNAFVNGYQLDITAGSFKGAAGKDALNIAESIEGDNAKCKTIVTSGLFSSDPSAYLAEDCFVHKSTDSSYPYIVTNTPPAETPIFVDEETSHDTSAITDPETKTAIEAVIDNAKVEGVADAVDESALVAGNVDADEVSAAKKVDVEIKVEVAVKSAVLSGEDADKTLTFEAKPVATIKVDGVEKATGVPVPNSLLSGDITVKLPLPTGFAPKQIKHTSADGSEEYFILDTAKEASLRGAKIFTIDANNCAVFTINRFSTFELSGTVTYTEPVPAYSVKVAAAENGTVTSNRRSATRGQTVTLTVSPADGYALDTLTVTDAKGNEIELTDKGDGKYTFKMPASRVTVSASFKKLPIFTDIDGRWYTPYIEWAAEEGIALDEDGSGLFHPDADCSRAAIVTFLWRAFGSQEPTITECPFTDVSESDSWYKAVLWAYENKITVGYDDPTVFAPDATSERAQTLTFLKRAVKAADVATGNDFTDVPEGAWYEAAVNWGVSEGLTNGYDDPTVFAPREDCSRAEIIAFIYRLLHE